MEKKVRNRVDKYKSSRKRKRKGFCGISYHDLKKRKSLDTGENIIENTEEIPHSSGGSTEADNLVIEKGNINQVLDVSANKLYGKEVTSECVKTADKVDIHGYKIIDADVLSSMINCCSKCTFCEARVFAKREGKRKCIIYSWWIFI